MQRILERVILGLGAIAFLVPLMVFPSDYIFPFIVPKILFFRSVVLVMIGVYSVLLFSDVKAYAPKKIALVFVLCAFLFSWLLSTIFGVDPYQSLWNNHERMLGLFTLLHYGAYALILSSVIRKKEDWRFLERVALGVGSLVMLLAVRQKIDPEWFLNRGATRVSATLGNPIYLSGYGLFILALGVWMFFEDTVAKMSVRYAYLVGAFLGFLGIFMGGTRGTLLGVFSGLGIISILTLWKYRFDAKVRRPALGVIALGVIVLALLVSFRQTSFIREIPSLGPLLNTELSEGTASTRLMAWKVAFEAWKAKPVFGWGPNNYYYAFNEFYRPEFLRFGYGETWFDNAHNVIMNTLATQGVLGVASYLGLFAAAVYTIFRLVKSGRINSATAIVMVGFTVAHLVHNLFVFENPTSYLSFFFFLALLAGYVMGEHAKTGEAKKAISWPSVLGAGIIVLLLLYSTDISPKRANQSALKTVQAVYGNPQAAIALYDETLAIPTPHIDDVRNDVGRVMGEVAGPLAEQKQKELAEAFLVKAALELEKNHTLHPRDVRINIQLASLFEQQAVLTGKQSYLVQAEEIMQQAIPFSPKRQQLAFTLATIKTRLGKFAEAEALLQGAVESDPKIRESWIRLLWLYDVTSQKEAVKKTLDLAVSSGIDLGATREELIKKYSLN